VRNIIALVLVLGAIAGPVSIAARAQTTHHAGEGFAALRAGLNVVGNTYRFRDTKPIVGAGGSLGAFLSPFWAVELETWMRASNPVCCAGQRETLVSLSVVRQYSLERVQPYLLSGLTFVRSDTNELQIQVGAGAQIPLVRRVALAVDIRGNGGGSTMILRPTVAAIYYFR
jgi:hypothetical protein